MRFLYLIILSSMLFCQVDWDRPYRVPVTSQQQISVLHDLGADIGVSGQDWVKIYADEDAIERITLSGFNPIGLVDTSRQNMLEVKSTLDWGSYHTYAELLTFLDDMEFDYPEFCEYFVIGETVSGRDIPGIKVTSDVSTPADKPEMIMIATIHGDEPVGTEFIIAFIESLMVNYGSDPTITRVVDSVELYFIPLLNPDGYIAGTRRNSNGRDLNRNFPVPDGGIGDDGTLTEEVETQAIKDFMSERYHCSSINFHGGAMVVNYPWDYQSTLCDDDDLCIARALDYSTRNTPMYTGDFPQGITNGYAWYEVDGTFQDWDYWQQGSIHLTIELNDTKWPSASLLDDIWEDNYESFLFATTRTLLGVRGIVTDSSTGAPLGATVAVAGNSMPLRCDPIIGDYHKMLLAGSYSLTYSHPGYLSKSFTVVVPDTGSIRLDVQLAQANYDTIYFSDFEDDDGGAITHSFSYYQDWQYGIPGYGPSSPYSGVNLWATRLMSDYNNSSQSRLDIPIDLSIASGAELHFMQWHVFQPSNSAGYHDGGNVKWSGPGGTVLLTPEGGYDNTLSTYNLFIPGEQAFTGSTSGWEEVVIDLSAFSGQAGSIYFDFGSSSVTTAAGWYIDDVAVYTAVPLGIVERESQIPNATTISAYPNPFNSSCRIDADESFTIYDIEGREVFSSNSGSTTWTPETGLTTGAYIIRAGTTSAKLYYIR